MGTKEKRKISNQLERERELGLTRAREKVPQVEKELNGGHSSRHQISPVYL